MFVPGNPPSWMEVWPKHQGEVWPSIDQGAMMATGKTNTHNHRWLSLLVIFKYINIMCIYTYIYVYIYTHVLKDSIWGYSIYIIYIPRRSQNVDTSDLHPGPGFTMAPRLEGLRETSAEGSTMTRCNPVICTSPHHFSVGFQTSLHDRFRYPLVNIQKTIENLHFE